MEEEARRSARAWRPQRPPRTGGGGDGRPAPPPDAGAAEEGEEADALAAVVLDDIREVVFPLEVSPGSRVLWS